MDWMSRLRRDDANQKIDWEACCILLYDFMFTEAGDTFRVVLLNLIYYHMIQCPVLFEIQGYLICRLKKQAHYVWTEDGEG